MSPNKYSTFYPVCKDPALPKLKSNSHQIFYHIKHSCQIYVYRVLTKFFNRLNTKYISIK